MKRTWIVSGVDRTVVLQLSWSHDQLRFSLENGKGVTIQSLTFIRAETYEFGINEVDSVIFSHIVRILRSSGASSRDIAVLYVDCGYIVNRWLEGKRL